MKQGDIVLYSLGDKTYNAIVLHVHAGQPDHLGANGEPLLHLAFIAPERESAIEKAKFGYIPKVFYEYDVVHFSHKFSDEYRAKNGLLTPAQIAAVRGQGEWEEVPESDELVATRLEVAVWQKKFCDVLDKYTVPPAPEASASPEPEPNSAPKE